MGHRSGDDYPARRGAEPLGLRIDPYEALMLLSFSRMGEPPLGKIGERLQVLRTSATNIIDGLEADGLVGRVRTRTTAGLRWPEATPAGRPILPGNTWMSDYPKADKR